MEITDINIKFGDLSEKYDLDLFLKVWDWVFEVNRQGELSKYFPRVPAGQQNNYFALDKLLGAYPGIEAKYLELFPGAARASQDEIEMSKGRIFEIE